MSRRSKRSVNSPSFSSSLLDKIFRSIDAPTFSSTVGATTTHHTTRSTSSDRLAVHQTTSEKKTKKIIGPIRRDKYSNDFKLHTTRNGPVSTSKPNPNHMIGMMKLKPIRTSTERCDQVHHQPDNSRKMNREGFRNSSKPKYETAFASPSIGLQNAKIRAQKMYGDSKDVKQPISPGGRLARFITSLFTKGNSSNRGREKVRETEAALRGRPVLPVTTCSSATSNYYRSCLSRKQIGASKKSVRFCPAAIDDELPDNPRLVALMRRKCELDGVEQRRISERHAESNLKELLIKKCKYNKNGDSSIYDGGKLSDEDKHDDEDGGSCGSSDLFELDHIGGTVNHSINDELPVYESTKFHSKNPAIW